MATRRRALGFGQSRVTEGDDMRAIDCPCGHHFEMQRTDDQLRERITADAYDPAAVT